MQVQCSSLLQLLFMEIFSNVSISILGQQFPSKSGWLKAIKTKTGKFKSFLQNKHSGNQSVKLFCWFVLFFFSCGFFFFFDLQCWSMNSHTLLLLTTWYPLWVRMPVYIGICVCVRAYRQTALAKVATVFSANSFKQWFISWTGRFSSKSSFKIISLDPRNCSSSYRLLCSCWRWNIWV